MSEAFWQDGLAFQCQQCSACCRHVPGFVFLTGKDILVLLEGLGLGLRAFIDDYCRWVDVGTGYQLSLRETASFDCVFWSAGGCAVYRSRPLQCRTYPFWAPVLANPDTWLEEAADCPGINQGPLLPAGHIEDCLWARRAEPVLLLSYDQDLEALDENTLLGGTRIDTQPAHSGTTEE